MSTTTDAPRTLAARPRALELLAKSPVAVLMGGESSEREVSLWTGTAVLDALRSPAVTGEWPGPARVHSVQIESDGRWVVDGRSRTALDALAELGPETVHFLALHGGRGENGTVQGLFDALGRLHTGSGVEASALCMNKHATRLVLGVAGIPVAKGRRVTSREWSSSRAAVENELGALALTGLSVKPSRGGSSVATTLLESASGLGHALEAVFATGDDAVVEERIRGAETTCGVLGTRGRARIVLPPVEIVPKAGAFFDFEEKYSRDGAREYCPPRSLAPRTVERIRELARDAFEAAGCDGHARIDFMIPRTAEGREEEPVALEINTLPGMTSRSLLPLAARTAGLSFRSLCLEILGLALEPRLAVEEHRA